MTKTEFFRYLAGYIDGDGHFKLASYKQDGYVCYHSKLMITSCTLEPLTVFKDILGGNISKKNYLRNKCSPEYLYTLHLSTKKRSEMKNILPYILEKKSQLQFILYFFDQPKCFRSQLVKKFKTLKTYNKASVDSISKIKSLSKISEPDYAYIAGYLDAEGSLTITRKKLASGTESYCSHFRVSSTSPQCIEYIYRCFGGSLSYRIPNKQNYTPYLSYEITNLMLDPILSKIQPYLINKLRQCEVVIALRSTFRIKHGVRSVEFQDHIKKVLPYRYFCFLSAKHHNKRGI